MDIEINPAARDNFNHLAGQMAARKPPIKFASVIADSEDTAGFILARLFNNLGLDMMSPDINDSIDEARREFGFPEREI